MMVGQIKRQLEAMIRKHMSETIIMPRNASNSGMESVTAEEMNKVIMQNFNALRSLNEKNQACFWADA